ncbi:hypothetical protein AB0H82_09120 [Streptomyces sp. NPDC050732]|uniref:hypothetical protein n=1 Tax=Streptomyces sp. NPDC050732 TaxID=3154632 RepID=UPI00344AD56B
MIRIVTAARLEQLDFDARAAHERARQANGAANAAFARHARELYAATDRAECADASAAELGKLLAGALAELAVAQEELLLKDIEIRRLREELEADPVEGQALTVLLHYGEPHMIYRSRKDAHADTSTHGVAPGSWEPAGERPPAACTWRCEAFIYDAGSNGFRRAFLPAPEPVGGAA